MEEKTNYLVHHGVKGMKWGVRRYQNADGSLTAAGRKQYGIKTSRKEKAKKAAKVAGGVAAGAAAAGAAASAIGIHRTSKKISSQWKYDNRKSESDKSGVLDRTIKRGKDKENISPATDVAKNVNNAIDNTGRTYRAIKDASKATQRELERAKRVKEVQKMSTEELRQKINRLNLEKQYLDLTDPYKNQGKDKVEQIIDVASGIGGLAVSAVMVAEGAKYLKGLKALGHSDEDEALIHYGVKGMKWKNRKNRYNEMPQQTNLLGAARVASWQVSDATKQKAKKKVAHKLALINAAGRAKNSFSIRRHGTTKQQGYVRGQGYNGKRLIRRNRGRGLVVNGHRGYF